MLEAILSKNDNCVIRVTFRSNFQNWTKDFTWYENDGFRNGIIVQELNRQINTKLSDIRRESYERGYRDGRAKRAKQKYFYGGW